MYALGRMFLEFLDLKISDLDTYIKRFNFYKLKNKYDR